MSYNNKACTNIFLSKIGIDNVILECYNAIKKQIKGDEINEKQQSFKTLWNVYGRR